MSTKFNKQYYAKDLDEAYKIGYFTGSMTRWELMERINKHHPELRWYASKTHRGLYDSSRSRFLLGISNNMTIPKYSIFQYDRSKDRRLDYSDEFGNYKSTEIINTDEDEGRLIVRGWKPTLEILESHGYKIDKRGL